MIGASIVSSLTPRFQLELDALYISRGFASEGANSTATVATSYLELPSILRLNLAPRATVQPFLAAGATIGFKVGCKLVFESNGNKSEADCDETGASDAKLNSTDIGALVGAGAEVPAGPVNLTLGVRFTRGFSRVYVDRKNHNETVGLYLGISKGRRK